MQIGRVLSQGDKARTHTCHKTRDEEQQHLWWELFVYGYSQMFIDTGFR